MFVISECVLNEGLADEFKSLLQMPVPPVFVILSPFTQAKRKENKNKMERGGDEGICMHTYNPSTHSCLRFCSSWSQQHTPIFSSLSFFLYI